MIKIGTFEFSETGFEGISACPTMRIRTKHGWLLCYPGSELGEYDEFRIDLAADDGRFLQMSVTGVAEFDEWPDHSDVHVYAWDGMHEDAVHIQPVRVSSDESCWW